MDRIRDTYGRPDRQVNDDGYFDEAEIWYYDKLGLKVHFEWSGTKDCEVVKTHYPPKP